MQVKTVEQQAALLAEPPKVERQPKAAVHEVVVVENQPDLPSHGGELVHQRREHELDRQGRAVEELQRRAELGRARRLPVPEGEVGARLREKKHPAVACP